MIVDDIIIKALEEIALNGEEGISPKDLWSLIEKDGLIKLNKYVKAHIHRVLLHSNSILIKSSGSTGGDKSNDNDENNNNNDSNSNDISNNNNDNEEKETDKDNVKEKKTIATIDIDKKEEPSTSEAAESPALVLHKSSADDIELPDAEAPMEIDDNDEELYKVTPHVNPLLTPAKTSAWTWTKQQVKKTKEVSLNKRQYLDLESNEDRILYLAEESLRNRSYGICNGIQLNSIQTKIISMISITRYQGCLQKDISDQLKIDARNIFFPIKLLITKGLVKKTSVYRPSTPGQVTIQTKKLFLTRFFDKREFPNSPWLPMNYIPFKICETLANSPNKEMIVTDLINFAVENKFSSRTTIKKVKKQLIDDGFIEDRVGTKPINGSSKQSVKEEGDDDNKEDEDEDKDEKSNSSKKGVRRVVYMRLIKPYTWESAAEKNDEPEEEEDEDGDDVGAISLTNYVGLPIFDEIPIIEQLYQIIKDTGDDGITIPELLAKMRIYSSKHITSGVKELISCYGLKITPIVRGKQMTYQLHVSGSGIGSSLMLENETQTTKQNGVKKVKEKETEKEKGKGKDKDKKKKKDEESSEEEEKEEEPKKSSKKKETNKPISKDLVLVKNEENSTQSEFSIPLAAKHRVKPKTVLYLQREKVTIDKIREKKGLLFTTLFDFMSKTDKVLDQKILNNILNELEIEGKVKILKIYIPLLTGVIHKNAMFIFDSKYDITDSVIKEVISSIRDSHSSMKMNLTSNEGKQESELRLNTIHFNKKIGLKYGMIPALYLRIKYFHRLLWEFVRDENKRIGVLNQPMDVDENNNNNKKVEKVEKEEKVENVVEDENNNNNNNNNNEKGKELLIISEFPEQYTLYLNSFLKKIRVDDYLKIIPQYKEIPNLDKYIDSSTPIVELPKEIRVNLFGKSFISRVNALAKIMKTLGLLDMKYGSCILQYVLFRDVELDSKKYSFISLNDLEEYWTDLQYIGLSDQTHEELSEKLPSIQNTAYWGVATAVTRAKKSAIYSLFRRDPPMTKAELIHISMEENVRLAKIESLYQTFIKKQKDSSRNRLLRNWEAKEEVSKILKKDQRKERPVVKTTPYRAQRWTHDEDIKLLNTTITVFAPFLEELPSFNYRLISVTGVPTSNNNLWNKVGQIVEKPGIQCHRRVTKLIRTYSSFKIQLQSHLKFKTASNIYDLPSSVTLLNKLFEQIQTDSTPFNNSRFEKMEDIILRDKILYQIYIPEDAFNLELGKQILSEDGKMNSYKIVDKLTRDRVIRYLVKNFKSRRFALGKIQPVGKNSSVDGSLFFSESQGFIDVAKRIPIEKIGPNELFRFEPLTSGGTVAQAIKQMYEGNFEPNINFICELELPKKVTQNSTTRISAKTSSEIEPILSKYIGISFILKKHIDNSYLKRLYSEEYQVRNEEVDIDSNPVYSKLLKLFVDDDHMEEDEQQESKEDSDSPDLLSQYQSKLSSDWIKEEFYKNAYCQDPDQVETIYQHYELLDQIYQLIVGSVENGITLKKIIDSLAFDLDENANIQVLDKVCNVVPSILRELLQMRKIQVLYGFYQKVYVANQYVGHMMLPLNTNEPLEHKIMLRPWVDYKGHIDLKVFNQIVFDIVVRIMEGPGITLESLSFKLRYYTPSFVKEITDALTKLGYIKTDYYEFKPPTLFSKSSYTVYPGSYINSLYYVAPSDFDPKRMIRVMFNPTNNIVNLPSDFSSFINLLDL